MTRLKTSAELKKEETAIVDNLVQDKPGTITISCGIRKLTRLKLVGQKVVDVRSQLSQPLKIHDTFQTLVNGKEVELDYVLAENDVVEFVKLSGSKG